MFRGAVPILSLGAVGQQSPACKICIQHEYGIGASAPSHGDFSRTTEETGSQGRTECTFMEGVRRQGYRRLCGMPSLGMTVRSEWRWEEHRGVEAGWTGW